MFIYDKDLQKTRDRGEFPQPEKWHLWKPIANITLSSERLKIFP